MLRLSPGWRLTAFFGLVIVTGLIWRPAVVFALGSALAALAGCELTERGPEPCIVAGEDMGLPLYRAYVDAGWGMVAAMPFMLVTLVIWTGIIRRWRRERRSVAN